MISFQFNNYVAQFGESATIKGFAPQLDDDGNIVKNIEDNSIVYDEVDVTVRCRIANNRGSESSKMRFQGAYPTMEESDATGLFKLSDAQYIKKGNKVVLSRNLSYTFEMLTPVEKKTHIEVSLKRNEV